MTILGVVRSALAEDKTVTARVDGHGDHEFTITYVADPDKVINWEMSGEREDDDGEWSFNARDITQLEIDGKTVWP